MKSAAAYEKIAKLLRKYDRTTDADELRDIRRNLSRTVLKLNKVYLKLLKKVAAADLEYEKLTDTETELLKKNKTEGKSDFSQEDIKRKVKMKYYDLKVKKKNAEIELKHFDWIIDKASNLDNSLASDFKYTMKDLLT